MTENEFEKRFMAEMSEQQNTAVKAVQGAVLLLAVPGSGKTTVLITRLGYMINCCGISPSEILAVSLHWIAVPLFRTSSNRVLLFSALLHTAANAMQSTMQSTRQSAVVIQYIRFFIYHCLLSNIVNGIYQ